jgi:tetratricopeptide (TPR) repeat protein
VTLSREVEDMDRLYLKMLRMANDSESATEYMARLSEINPHYRSFYLSTLKDEAVMREIRIELSKDPELSRFSAEQRKGIVENWVKRGDLASAEVFLSEHSESVEDSWWLWSLLRRNNAEFEQAVEFIRENVEVHDVPAAQVDELVLSRLSRAHAIAPKDIMKGTVLIQYHMEKGEYTKALPILERLLKSHQPPLYLYYWRAECLYLVEEYIESWYGFEVYLEKLWER